MATATTPTVAIIADDRAVRAMMAAALREDGFETFAWRAAGTPAAQRPDIIVLDLQGERTRAGIAALTQIRADTATADVPVLVCTADHHFADEWRAALREQGCVLLTKPFTVADLRGAARALVGHPTTARVAAPAPPPPSPEEAAEPRKQIIALVDDTGRGVSLLADGVDAKGYAAAPWRWGNGLRAMVAGTAPDLVIVDLPASRWPAFAVALRHIRCDGADTRPPFILLADRALSLTPPARCRIVEKPIERHALYAIIADLVGPPPAIRLPPKRRPRQQGFSAPRRAQMKGQRGGRLSR